MKPRHIATPIAEVEYPVKSKNICPEKASTPAQASSGPVMPPEPKKVSAVPASRVSAQTTFINKPSDSNNKPSSNCWRVALCSFSNCGTSCGGRTIGPATRCGKKVTNNEKSSIDFTGSLFFLYMSTV